MSQTTVAVKAVAVAFATATLVGACGDSPTRPSAGLVVDPVVVIDPYVTKVSLEGPENVPLGETVQFSLIGQLSDGSRRDLTKQAEWPQPQGDSVSIDGPGLVTGRKAGQTEVLARFEHLRTAKLAIALPQGTYRLLGYLRETGGGPSVADALVEVTSGVGRGLSAVTDYYGFYALFGVAGETHLRISKAGYFPTVIDYLVINENQEHHPRIGVRRPHDDVSGVYSLTITVASECEQGLVPPRLPEEAAVRTYKATVDQSKGRLLVSLEGPTVQQIRFGGRVEPSGATFEIQQPSHSDEEYPFVDSLSDSRYLVVSGRASLSISSKRLEGTLDGTIQVFEEGRAIAGCRSTNHRFEMER